MFLVRTGEAVKSESDLVVIKHFYPKPWGRTYTLVWRLNLEHVKSSRVNGKRIRYRATKLLLIYIENVLLKYGWTSQRNAKNSRNELDGFNRRITKTKGVAIVSQSVPLVIHALVSEKMGSDGSKLKYAVDDLDLVQSHRVPVHFGTHFVRICLHLSNRRNEFHI